MRSNFSFPFTPDFITNKYKQMRIVLWTSFSYLGPVYTVQ